MSTLAPARGRHQHAAGRGARPGLGMAYIGLGTLIVLTLVALLAPLIAPYAPRAFSGDSLEAPSSAHLLGTNETGQDIFSQLVYGARDVLLVAPTAAVLTVAIGTVIGVSAAVIGGTTGAAITRVIDATLALPRLPLLVFLAVSAGPSMTSVILSVALLSWPMTARVVRAQTLTLRQRDFVTAARSFGASRTYIARRHMIPALAPILVAGFVTVAALAVLLEAGLAFLGLTDPTRSSWGLMMNDALSYSGLWFGNEWLWWLLPPGFAVSIAILGFTLLGVGLEPRLNVRLPEHTA